MLTLSLWQISVIAAMAMIAVLIGTLVVIARTLANRVGKAYAALRRIEEVLIAANAPRGHASGVGASIEAVGSAHGALGSDFGVRERRNREGPVREMAHREATHHEVAHRDVARREVAVPEMLLAEEAAHEMSAAGMSAPNMAIPERDRRVSYLTVRDLKVMARSGRRRSDTELSQEAAAQLSTRLFSAVQRDAASADARLHAGHAGASDSGPPQAWASQASAVQADAGQPDAGLPDAVPDPIGLSSSSTVLQELATATSEVRALLNESAEPAGEPICAVVAADEAVAEAHEEMYAYSELSVAPVRRTAPEAEFRAMPEWVPDPLPMEAARELEPIEAAPTAAVRELEPTEAAPTAADRKLAPIETAPIEAPSIEAHLINVRSVEAPEAVLQPDFVLAPRVESPPAPAEASIEATAPVTALSNPTEGVEDQPAPPVSSETEAELAEKRRKRTAELILAAHHRRRRARGH